MLIQDISFIIGDTLPINVSVNKNLNGCTVKWYLKNDIDDADTAFVLSRTTPTNITVTDAVNGLFSFELSAVETAALKVDYPYYHEIKITDTLGKVVTALSGTVTGSNGSVSYSYATVDYADTYFDNNVLFPEPWTTTDAATKAKALKMATKKIDALPLVGRKVDPEQMLAFPRCLYSDTYGVWFEEPKIADIVKEATCEEALALLRGGSQAQGRAQLQRQGVTSFSLGALSEAYSGAYGAPNKLLSEAATQLLARYTGGGRTFS